MRLRELRQARHAWMKVNTIWAQVSTTYLGLLRSLGLKYTNALVLLCFARGLFCSHILYIPLRALLWGGWSGREMSGSVGWCAARRRRKEAEGKVQVPSCKRRGGVGGWERGGREELARARRRPRRACMPPHVHANTGGWQRRAPRRATSDAGASAAHAAARPGGRVREPRGHSLGSPRRPAALAPRASPLPRGGL